MCGELGADTEVGRYSGGGRAGQEQVPCGCSREAGLTDGEDRDGGMGRPATGSAERAEVNMHPHADMLLGLLLENSRCCNSWEEALVITSSFK